MTVSIHQPNLFPWLGYFQKIANADKFVYLDHTVQNPRNSSWIKRVQLIINGNPQWVTIGLKSAKDQVCIPLTKIQINTEPKWDIKLRRTIEQNYSKSLFYKEVMPLVDNYFRCKSKFLVERNILFIESVCQHLEIDNQRVRSSELEWSASSTELLIEIVNKVGGTNYLSGDGSEGYQLDELFVKAGIQLNKLSFQHPVYEQRNSDEFVDGLSIIDVLMNIGFEGTRHVLDVRNLKALTQ